MKYPNLELIEYISKQVLNVKDPSALYPTCTMYVFPQTWASTALGFDEHGGLGGQAFTSTYTTVVEIKYRVKGGGFSTLLMTDIMPYSLTEDLHICILILANSSSKI